MLVFFKRFYIVKFKLPNKSTIIKDIERDSDNRGRILSIVDHNIKNVSKLLQTNYGVYKYKEIEKSFKSTLYISV